MPTEAQKRAAKKWRKNNVTQRNISFYPSHSEELAWLDKQPNKNAYIIGLIREDMERNQ